MLFQCVVVVSCNLNVFVLLRAVHRGQCSRDIGGVMIRAISCVSCGQLFAQRALILCVRFQVVELCQSSVVHANIGWKVNSNLLLIVLPPVVVIGPHAIIF